MEYVRNLNAFGTTTFFNSDPIHNANVVEQVTLPPVPEHSFVPIRNLADLGRSVPYTPIETIRPIPIHPPAVNFEGLTSMPSGKKQ